MISFCDAGMIEGVGTDSERVVDGEVETVGEALMAQKESMKGIRVKNHKNH